MTNRGRPPLVSDEKILDAALASFATIGYQAMSVRALNAELGLSHETISKRFGPKDQLFRAAVQHGAASFIEDFDRELATAAATTDLDMLRATLRAFMMAVSRHHALGDLLHHDSIDLAQRTTIIDQTGLADRIASTAELLERLQRSGTIRRTGIRELWFLAHGAAAPLHFGSLAAMFDPFDGPLDTAQHIERMTDTIVRGLRTTDPGTQR